MVADKYTNEEQFAVSRKADQFWSQNALFLDEKMTFHGHFLIVTTSSKYTRGIRAASLNDRKDRTKDRFSPGECMLVVQQPKISGESWSCLEHENYLPYLKEDFQFKDIALKRQFKNSTMQNFYGLDRYSFLISQNILQTLL